MKIIEIFRKSTPFIETANNISGIVSLIFGFGSISVFAFGWLISQIEQIYSYGYPAIICISIVITSFIFMSIGIFLIGYRKLKPYNKENNIVNQMPKEIFEHIDAIANDRILAQIKNIEIFHSKEENKDTYLHAKLETISKTTDQKISELNKEIDQLRQGVNIRQSAQFTKEMLDKTMEEIDKLIIYLSAPSNENEAIDDWPSWLGNYEKFKWKIDYMCQLSSPYIDIRNSLYNIPHERLKSHNWSFNSIGLTEDQKHDYKIFRITASNYLDCKAKVYSKILNVINKNI